MLKTSFFNKKKLLKIKKKENLKIKKKENLKIKKKELKKLTNTVYLFYKKETNYYEIIKTKL